MFSKPFSLYLAYDAGSKIKIFLYGKRDCNPVRKGLSSIFDLLNKHIESTSQEEGRHNFEKVGICVILWLSNNNSPGNV